MRRKRFVLLMVALLLIVVLGALVYVYLTLGGAEPAEAMEGPGFRFVRAIYGWGPDPDQLFKGPYGVASANGELYITDQSLGGIYVMTEEGDLIRQIGKQGRAPGEVMNPLGISVGPEGQVVVADRNHGKVVVYDQDGTYLRELKADIPLASSFGGDGRLYLTVAGGIDVYDASNYEKVAEWGERGKEEENYDFPNGIGEASAEQLVVSDGNNQRIKGVTRDGEVQWVLGEPPASMSDTDRLWGQPGGIAVVDGIVYMVDPLNGAIHLISQDGKYLAAVGQDGDANGTFSFPSQIAHISGDRFAVTEWGLGRVSIVDINPQAAIEAWQENTSAPSPGSTEGEQQDATETAG
jgi:hypothetical protein